MTEQPTLFVVDDDPAVSDSLTELAVSLDVATECHASAESFLATFDLKRTGCVVLDVRMPGISGIELQQRLVAMGATIPIVFITGHGDVPMSVRAMKQGASHFLEKPIRPSELAATIRDALEIDRKQRVETRRNDSLRLKIAQLTDDELCVLKAIARGRSNPQIARDVSFSERTVQFRRASLMKKFGVADKAELLDLLLSGGWSPFESAPTTRRQADS
jgi:FixJ family two-component response regulator